MTKREFRERNDELDRKIEAGSRILADAIAAVIAACHEVRDQLRGDEAADRQPAKVVTVG